MLGHTAKTGGGLAAERRKLNSTWVRKVNAQQILQALRDHGHVSQRRIGEVTGLDKATVSTVVAQLASFGLITRSPAPSSGRQGRPEVALSIPQSAGVVVGVLLEPGRIDLIASDMAGQVRQRDSIAGASDVDLALGRLADGIDTISRRFSPAPLLAVGVGVPALIDSKGWLLQAPNLGWRDLPIAGLLAERLPMPVLVENDTKAAAVAERRFGSCRAIDDFIYVTAHSGVGGALYFGGSLYRGASGLAGEIGHIEVVPDGRPCGCGARGCLEAYLSEPALQRQLVGRRLDDGGMEGFARLASAGEPDICALLADAGHHLAKALAGLVNALNPERVVLGGDLALIAPYILPACRRQLEALALPSLRRDLAIEPSPLGRDAVAMGGVALAIEAAQDRLLDRIAG